MAQNGLPRGWRLIPLEEVGDFINGYAFKPSDWGKEGLPIIRIQNLNDPTKPYNYFAGQIDDRFRVRSGDVLISWSASLGVFRWHNGDAWLNQHIFKVVPKSKVALDVDYFHWAVMREIEVIAALAHGSTMQHVTRKFFLQSQIPLPPIAEQRQIGQILRSLETTLAAVERKLNLENERRVVLRNDLFSFGTRGEPLTASAIGAIPQNWQIAELGELITSGPQNGIYKPFSAYGEGTQIVRIDNFDNDGRFSSPRLRRVRLSAGEVKLYQLASDDVLINRVNSLSHLGKTMLVPAMLEPTVYESNMMRFRVNQARTKAEYIARFLGTAKCRAFLRNRAKRAVAQSSINQGDVRSIAIPIPAISEQEEIVSLLRACDKVIESLECEQRILNELARAMTEQLVKGGISVTPLLESVQQ